MHAGGKCHGRPTGKASKSKASPAQDAPLVRQTQGRGRGRSKGRGKGRGRGRGRGSQQTRPASPTINDVSAGSSDSEVEEQKQALGELQATNSTRQLRERSGSVRYDEGPSQQDGTGVLADDDSVECEAAAPDV